MLTPEGYDEEHDLVIPPEVLPRDGSYARAWYQLSDPQGSIVAVLAVQSLETGAVGRTVDRMEYDPYGNVRRSKLGDFDHNGIIDADDLFMFLDAHLGEPIPRNSGPNNR